MKIVVLMLLVPLLSFQLWAADERTERLLGLSTDFERGQISFEVASSGCTDRRDFRTTFKDNILTLYRMRPDDCKAMPQKMPVIFTLEELGLSPHQPFALGNSIIVNENLTGQ